MSSSSRKRPMVTTTTDVLSVLRQRMVQLRLTMDRRRLTVDQLIAARMRMREKKQALIDERMLKLEAAVLHGGALQTYASEIERQITKTEDDIAKIEAEMAEIKAEMAEISAEIARISAEIAEIKAEIAEAESVVPADPGKDYFQVVKELGPPSSLQNPEKWRRAQQQLVYLCHVPPDAEPPFPLTLAHPAFANFVDTFYTSEIKFGSQECEVVVELCELVATDFPTEKLKMEKFNSLLSKYLREKILPLFVAGSYPTDGSVLVARHMIYHSEEKKDEGNALFQAIHYYGLYLAAMEDVNERENTFCPCFLVELVGFHLRISGLAYYSKVACQPFTPFMHCYINSYDKADMDGLCRALLALKGGVSELEKYYHMSPPKVDKRIPYPLQEKNAQYLERIADDKLLFVVEMRQSQRRLFKFCKRYGKAVHELWAQVDLAPNLFSCEKIKGGWTAVEMEYLSAEDGWKSVHQWGNKSRLQLAVESALQIALDQNKEFAHGDMRAPNIMARPSEEGFEIKFVDFDWAGSVSSTVYPSFSSIHRRGGMKAWDQGRVYLKNMTCGGKINGSSKALLGCSRKAFV